MPKVEKKTMPTLNTVIMVEDTIKDMPNSASRVSEIKKALPKQVNHNTLKVILEYLENSNKIVFSSKGVTWIFNTNKNIRLRRTSFKSDNTSL